MEQLEQIPCAALVTDLGGKILHMNSEMVSVAGGEPQAWLQHQMDNLLPPASRIFLLTYVWPMLHDKGSVREIYMHMWDANRQEIPLLVNSQLGEFFGEKCYYWTFFVALQRTRFEAELLKARAQAQKVATDLAEANARLAATHRELELRARELEATNRELAELSQSDPLTGLGNRRALAASIRRWQIGVAADCYASLLLIDVDHFKSINDRFGHDAGDRVLVALAKRLRKAISENDLAVRYGGEEFAIWLPSADEARAESIAKQLHESINQICISDRTITISIGVATSFDVDNQNLMRDLIKCADDAVYAAKESGRNRTVHYHDRLRARGGPLANFC